MGEFDGKELENSKDIEIKHSKNKTSLTFNEAKIVNNGYYTCRVKNELGSDRTRARLTVTTFSAEDAEKAEKKKTERRASKVKMAKAEEAKMAQLQAQQAAKKPEPKPEPKKAEPAKPQKTWGAAGSKKAEPPKA